MTTWHRLGAFVLECALALFFGYVILQWASGCGETYTNAEGDRVPYECVFPHPNVN